MIPTVVQCTNLTRSIIGDTFVPGGTIFTDNFLIPYFSEAYSALLGYLSRNGAKSLRKDYYFNLPANTSSATPAGLGINNNTSPEEIYDRPIATSLTGVIAAVNDASTGSLPSVDVTVTGHPYASGMNVVTFGFSTANITDDINSEWTITVLDANTIRLNGCGAQEVVGGTAVGTAGVVSTGSQPFSDCPLQQVYDTGSLPLTSQLGQLSSWMWQNGYFRFVPSTNPRQIKIDVALSGSAPNSGSVGIDDSLSALAFYTAASAGAAKRPAAQVQSWWMRAIGNPSGDMDNVVGGAFRALARQAARNLNNSRITMPRFREKRNTGPNNGFGAYRW